MKNLPVIILGAGKMASFLLRSMSEAGIHVAQIYARDTGKLAAFHPEIRIDRISDFSLLKNENALYILAVSDDAIQPLSASLPVVEGIVVHTSGAMPIDAIHEKHSRRGVFYPLQTLAGKDLPKITDVPMLLEAKLHDDLDVLKAFAVRISDQLVELDSPSRLNIHLAAVMVNNFTNHLYELSEEILGDLDQDLSLLYPLMDRTLELAKDQVNDRRTGPAARGDEKTIIKHIELIKNNEHLLELYQTFTASIKNAQKKPKP